MNKNLIFSKSYFNIYLVRHGETDENKTGVIQGQRNTKLSTNGIEQARSLGKRLADIKFTHAYSSDLDRAYQTASNILSFNNYPASEITTDQLLRERKFGDAEGKIRKEFLESLSKKGLTLQDFVPNGAETTYEVFQRAVKFFENLCQEISTNNNNTTSNLHVLNSKLEYLLEDSHQVINTLPNDTRLTHLDKDDIESLLSSSYNSLDENLIVKNNINTNKTIDETTSNTETPSSGYCCEDTSISPFEENIADILIVSHGALLRELFKYFVYDLRCDIPNDHSILKQVPDNTALSKFTVQLGSNQNELPKLTCHLFHDKEHLTKSKLESKTLCNM